ncbi:THAP domain-containing protein 1-like [Aphis craccivora]|uniref:THAP domain-containing protein 1-like n=1 Tax=Aphis craccivora TaxID=307492 RepID=A0A6G0VTA2_APHCR|nr:THAP domain-containing protein 1-like [Aphis craccivora]
MPSCFVYGRSKNPKSKSHDISFHKFPLSNTELMGKWNDFLMANNLSSNNLTKNSIICSCRFDASNFLAINPEDY